MAMSATVHFQQPKSLFFALAIGVLALTRVTSTAQEVSLNSLASPEEEEEVEESQYGPYTGVFFGKFDIEDAVFTFNDLLYSMDESKDNFLMGFEVGYAWRTKMPLEFALSFEGMYGSGGLRATIDDPTGVPGNQLGSAFADMNAATFLLNFQMTLDMRCMKPRIGHMYRFRPYLGVGVGGSQVWYRNQTASSVSQLAGGVTALAAPAPYEIDEFLFTHQVNLGMEFRVSDEVDLYIEYRRLILDTISETTDLESSLIMIGLQYRY